MANTHIETVVSIHIEPIEQHIDNESVVRCIRIKNRAGETFNLYLYSDSELDLSLSGDV